MSRFNIPGLLGAIGELPSVLTKGLLGPLPVNPNMGLDPSQVKMAQDQAVQDMAFGMMATPSWNRAGGLMMARQGARDNYSGRIIDMLREQEIARVSDERKKREANFDAYRSTLPEDIRPIAEVAGLPNVAQAQIESAFAPPPNTQTDDIKEYQLAVQQGFTGTLQDWIMAQKKAGATSVNVPVSLGQPNGLPDYLKARQTSVSEQLGTLENQAGQAQQTVAQLDDLIKRASDAKLSGTLAPGIIGLGNFARSIGLDVAPEELTKARDFQAANNQAVLRWMASAGGARGFTEKETQILVDAFGKIEDSPEARVTILKTLRSAKAREYEAARKGISTKRQQLEDIAKGGLGVTEYDELPSAPLPSNSYPTAVNPKTGETIIFKDGKWQAEGK